MDALPARKSKEGILIDLKVFPGSKADSVGFLDGMVLVRTTEPADKGKANKAVLKLLKPIFGDCSIKSGFKSRKKTVLVHAGDLESLRAAFKGFLGREGG